MGGFGSGSQARSWRSTTSDFVSIDSRGMSQSDLFPHLDRRLPIDSHSPVELEFVARENDSYDRRVWVGTSTGYGFDVGANEVGRSAWLSERSMFIRIVDTRPHLGGRRFWFLCPRSDCGRRCRILYRERNTNARAFACRLCYRLGYQTQRMGKMDRFDARAEKHASRLIQTTEGELLRPRWMHRRTFDRLARQVIAFDRAADKVAANRYSGLQRVAAALRLEAKRSN